jgi:hypothetical protein
MFGYCTDYSLTDISYKEVSFHTAVKGHCTEYSFPYQWTKCYKARGKYVSCVTFFSFPMLCSYEWVRNIHLCLSSHICCFETFFILLSHGFSFGPSKVVLAFLVIFSQSLVTFLILLGILEFYIISVTCGTCSFIQEAVLLIQIWRIKKWETH